MTIILQQQLIAALKAQRQLNRTPEQAISQLAGTPLGAIGAVVLASSLREVYQSGITALEIAIILKQLNYPINDIALALRVNFPDLAALSAGQILLDPKVYPATARPALVTALEQAGYPADESELAANVLFPVTVTVQARLAWQDAGLTVSGTQTTTIAYKSGRWSASPSTGMCDGRGDPGYVAKPYYTLPGAPEAALVARIGTRVFLVGNSVVVPAGLAGPLQLCINDDLERRYGVGLIDNQGSLVVAVSTAP